MAATKKPAPRRRAQRGSKAAPIHVRVQTWAETVKALGYMLMMVGAVFVGFWALIGRPHAQVFIKTTVQEQFAQVGDQINALTTGQAETQTRVADVAKELEAIKGQLETNARAQEDIIRLLQPFAAPGGQPPPPRAPVQ